MRIVRGGTSRTKRAYGIDPVQALELGLQLARILLQLESPKITFEGAQRPGDVGIDKVITSALGVDFAEEMERMLEKAYLARSRQLERHHKTKRKTVR